MTTPTDREPYNRRRLCAAAGMHSIFLKRYRFQFLKYERVAASHSCKFIRLSVRRVLQFFRSRLQPALKFDSEKLASLARAFPKVILFNIYQVAESTRYLITRIMSG